MSESILKALMRLFAIIANFEEEGESSSARSVVESYLKQHLNQEQLNEYLKLFDEYYELHHSKKGKKRLSANSVKVLAICEQINEELQQNQKLLVLFQLLEFINKGEGISEEELDFVKTVSDTFNISSDEFNNIKAFIVGNISEVPGKANLLLIDNNKEIAETEIKHIINDYLTGNIAILNIVSTSMYIFKYIGDENLSLNGHNVKPTKTYVLDKGSSIRSTKISPIYYSDVVGKFLQAGKSEKIVYSAQNVEFRFKNSNNGIHTFNFCEESGQLVGIMGGSGVGKSTLLNVLNGKLKIQSGKILINGYDTSIPSEREMIEGVIGFIPQDDLLIEELTVYQNLYYNAKLCFNNFTKEQIEEAVEKVLIDLNLFAIKDLKVGGPLNKFISGGQRKRLNIALELIREPSVLFVDEPTSGLSSMDSDMVMDLLKEQTLKGKLVIVNIHQPSSDIFKLFDKLIIMDTGGHPIYYGNPLDGVVYFKKMSNHVNANESECITCGNVNPEQILQIVESKVVDEYGKLTRSRKTSAKEWFELYQKNIVSNIKHQTEKTKLPKNYFKIPSRIKQFFIFTARDVLSKLTNKQYLIITLLEAPALAVILGYFTKYISGTLADPNEYVFSLNENLPAYFFMSVVVSLFLGMTISAEEIIKDRKIIQRESFLNLSRFSYLNSKILIMFAISAIQSLTFIAIGNAILGIHGMTLSFWLVLFTTSCFANMLGLNISAALNSVVTIYILIPFILVPQLLLSGTIVSFDKLHKNFTSHFFVPFSGDVMTSRWAYEALVVKQFKHNEFQKHFFEIDKTMSNATYVKTFLVPKLEGIVNEVEKNIYNKEKEKAITNVKRLKNEFEILIGRVPEVKFKSIDKLTIEKYDENVMKESRMYLELIKKKYIKEYNNASYKKEEIFNKLVKELGSKEALDELKQNYHNQNLADLVLNKKELNKIIETDDRFVQAFEPIYKEPESNYGRAHFYAPVKIVLGYSIDTFWFNIMVIWLTSLFMYVTLLTDALKKLLDKLENIKIFKKK
ncbi:MAG TPA: ABC transporter [Bacteroidales bacterium]|nr:ABC transporter [Bacteroidales bacterium]